MSGFAQAASRDAARGGAQDFARQIAAHAPSSRACLNPWECDRALRWLTASDRIVSERAGRALLEVEASRLYLREGHARW